MAAPACDGGERGAVGYHDRDVREAGERAGQRGRGDVCGRVDVAREVEKIVADHPLYPVLTSMPGVAVRTAAIIIAETSGKTFKNSAALASYAGLAPQTRQSGTSIRSERVSHAGNKRLKRALFLSAFASIRTDPTSRAYYNKKRSQGKRHNQALIALAHRRLTVLHAMIRDGSLYDTPPATPLAA